MRQVQPIKFYTQPLLRKRNKKKNIYNQWRIS